MHIFFVGEEIPFHGKSGSHINGLAMVRYFLKKGHRVTAFVDPPKDYYRPDEREMMIRQLNDMGVMVVSLHTCRSTGAARSKWKKLLFPLAQDFYPVIGHHGEIGRLVQDYVERMRPDVLLAYGLPAIYFSKGVRQVPRIAPICEDPSMFAYARWRFNVHGCRNGLRRNLNSLASLYTAFCSTLQAVSVYRRCSAYGQFSADYLRKFRLLGATRCKYYRSPVQDPVGEDWHRRRDQARQESARPKIIMLGALSTSTWAQYKVLDKYILPELDARLGKDGYEVHLIGNSTVPEEFRNMRSSPAIRVRGYVDDIAREFLSADVLLSPTPIKLGNRIRIIEGLAYGSCIVTTQFDKNALPELEHRQNALIARKNTEIAGLIALALGDPDLTGHIRRNARSTYEKFFRPEAALPDMENDMIRLTGTFSYPPGYRVTAVGKEQTA